MPENKVKATHSFTRINQVRFIRGGKDYFDTLLSLIDSAKENIHLQSYIFDDDKTGQLVAEALKNAAERKVEVFLIADGYASQVLSRAFIKSLKKSGIHFRFFEPFFKSNNFYFGRRMHHKLTVVDGRYALVGGVNIADRYNDLPGKPAWLDFALYTEGEIAAGLRALCLQSWKDTAAKMAATSPAKSNYIFNIPFSNRSEVRMRRNDWVRKKNEISASYIQMFRTAQSHVTVLCSYFLPGKVMREQIRFAVSRGVRVRIVTAGISDVTLAKNAERWLYDWLIRNKIELYEYQKNVLHGKLGICDDKWMTIGSYNINDISAFASIELNLDVKNAGFVTEVRKLIEEIIDNDCRRVTVEELTRSKNIFRQLIQWASYQFIRVVFHLFTFYFKRRA